MTRRIITALPVWDVGVGSGVVLQPGAMLNCCRIRRDGAAPSADPYSADPYIMEFECSGRWYTCPLFSFQPRTETAEAPGVEEPQARVAAAS